MTKRLPDRAKAHLPKTIYVYVDEDGYLIASDSLREAAAIDETRVVGVYELQRAAAVIVDVKLDV